MPKNLKILKHINCLSVEECLRVNKKNIELILISFQVDPAIADKIKIQWENLLLRKWRNTLDTEMFWGEVFQHTDAAGENPYRELANFAMSILVLPISNAEVERMFSSMNVIKSKIRNRMQLKLTNSILTIRNSMRFGVCCIDHNIPDEIIKKVGTNAAYEDICESDFSIIEEIM